MRWDFETITGDEDFILGFFVFVVTAIAPLIASVFVPFIWTLEDAKIKRKKSESDVENFESAWRGRLEGIIGVGALISLLQFWFARWSAWGLTTVETMLNTLYSLVFQILLIAGVVLLSILYYFYFYHEGMVNQVRIKVSKFVEFKKVVTQTLDSQ